jgi:hypothetical protein
MRTVAAAALSAALILAAGPARAQAPAAAAPVIGPGQDQLLGRLLQLDGAPGGCKVATVSVDKDHVSASYTCAGMSVPLELHHPATARPAALKTERFAVVAPGAAPPVDLLRDLEKSLRAGEGAWVWSKPTGGDGVVSDSRPEDDAEYKRGLDLYREKKFAEAYVVYVGLARKSAKLGVLGMVVASLASTHPTPERVAALAADADRAPGDILAQFTAGVGAHYYAHQSAPTKAVKNVYYEAALKYLARANPTYAYEPRLWIYLAVSNFRLGHQAEAEALIERAVALGADDPDAYYCRAEIFQQKNVTRSLADLDFYLAQMKKNESAASISAPEKTARVERMKEYLLAVSRGERQPVELFDPVTDEAARAAGGGGRAFLPLAGLAAALLVLLGIRRAKAR